MTSLSLLKSCLISSLDRIYLQEKWISDQSLVTILQGDFGLDFVNKWYINKYLPDIYLNKYNCTHVQINALKNAEKKSINVRFYYFSKSSVVPRHLSTRKQWQDVYDHFKVLRTNQHTCPTKVLKENTNIEVTNEDKINLPEKRKTIYEEIGNYFTSPEALRLFNPNRDKSVEDCLS